MATSTQWRINVTDNNDRTSMGFAEVWLRTGAGVAMGSGTPSASSEFSGTWAATKAVDRVTSTYWATATTVSGWWQFTFDSTVDITHYEIQGHDTTSLLDATPKDWTLEYYNGSSWVAVDTRAGVVGWSAGEIKSFVVGSGVTLQNSQTAVEVLRLPTAPNLQLTASVVEVLRSNGVETFTPTLQRILSMDYVFGGQPFVQLAADDIDTSTLDFAHGAQPFSALHVLSDVAPPEISARPQVFCCT